MKKIIILMILFLVMLFSFKIMRNINGTQKNDLKQEKIRIPTVKVIQVATGRVEEKMAYVGNIAGQEEVTLMSKVPGKIDSFLVEEGDKVKKDDVLVLIDRDVEGMKYEKASIKSPFDGMVIKKYLDEGSQVEPSVNPLMRMPVIMIANIDTVKVLVNISEKYLGKLKEKAETEVKVDAYPDKVFYGEITKIAPLVDISTRTAEIEIRVSNKEHLLKPGMFARVNIILEKKENALVVPVKAVLDENNRKFVFVVYPIIKETSNEVNGSIVCKKEIKTGIYQKDSVEIIEGLSVGEDVIIEGNYGLKDSTNVLIETKENIQ